MGEKKDFFVSYTGNDEQWAKWIAGTLEKAGYSTIIQAWDFRAGENFVNNMHNALINSDRFIAVLSEEYLESLYCQAEWQAAFTKDPGSEKGLFIMAKIDNVKPEGLLAPIIYIDLHGTDEAEAEKRLLEGVSTEGRPRNRPGFPGTKRANFPGELPFNNLPLKNSCFTGRQGYLEKIKALFDSGKAVALSQVITGLGGIGKTQVALEYAFRHAYLYDCVWWVNAESNESIIRDYTEFTKKRGLLKDNFEPELVIDAAKTWMADINNKWLFIFDNVEQDDMLDDFLPPQQQGQQHLLITSRLTQFRQEFQLVAVDVFEPEEALEFLETHAKLPPNEHAENLAKELGYLPLALDQAAAYIKVCHKSYEEYLHLFREKRLQLLAKHYRDANAATVAATWDISMEKIQNEGAKQLLPIISFLASDNIQKSWFSNSAEVLPEPLRQCAGDEMLFDELIADLERYSLIRVDHKTINIHRLLQEVVRDRQDNPQELIEYAMTLLGYTQSPDFSSYEGREYSLDLIPHVLSTTQHALEKNIESETLGELCHYLGCAFYEFAEYPKSLWWSEKALNIFEKVLGPEHPVTVLACYNIAEVYNTQSDYTKALKLFKKVLCIRKKVLGPNHTDTATTYNNIALVYKRQGDYTKALKLYKKALSIRKKVLGPNHTDTATTYNNIANLYLDLGDYSKAMESYEKAISIREKAFGLEDSHTAISYNNIANLYLVLGDYPKAMEWCGKALSIVEEVLGPEQPLTATTYNSIASIYVHQGDYSQALEWFGKAFIVFLHKLGPEHPDTSTVLKNMKRAYDKSGNTQDFEEWLLEKLRE